jgi:hypothetical protein
MPSQTFFGASEAAIFLTCHFIVVLSIPRSIHGFNIKYLKIKDSLFSQEEQIRTCLQQHLERFNSVLNS